MSVTTRIQEAQLRKEELNEKGNISSTLTWRARHKSQPAEGFPVLTIAKVDFRLPLKDTELS